MRYSQGDGVITSLSRITYCTYVLVLYRFSYVLLSCVWESSAARSCADWDNNNKDNVCEQTIPAGLKCPPPSKTISSITWFEA